MDLFDIAWPKTPVHCNGVCQGNTFVKIQEVQKSAELGCPKCLLIHNTTIRLSKKTNLSIRVEEGRANPISLDDGEFITSHRLLYLYNTARPAWDLIQPGNLLFTNRREEYLPLLAGWLENCNSKHKDCTVPDSILPKRVLDVGTETTQRLRLHISSNEVSPYVALSHCWGPNGIQIKTTNSTLETYRQRISFEDLPMNFRDAVTITRAIGIRYLWIDSFCIVQDDTTDWQVESSKMASIYRDAYLVLAATRARDSCEGFLDRTDIDNGSNYRLPPFDPQPVQAGRIRNPDSTVSEIYIQEFDPAGIFARHHDTVSYSPLNSRAWALQENILPRRIVHFTSRELLWECIRCLKCECMRMDEAPRLQSTVNLVRYNHFFGFGKYYHSGSATLHRTWICLLEAYCRLKISHESDRLPALSGLAHLWKSRGAGVYLAGLWQDDIVNSLIWRPDESEQIKGWKGYKAPSWSPFALGYTLDDHKPVSANFQFPTDDAGSISKTYAKVVDSYCIPEGQDEMGTVKDGSIILKTLVAVVHLDDTKGIKLISSDCTWDRGIEDAIGREITLILLGFFEFNSGEACPRALITVPSKRIAGAYERMGLLSDRRNSRLDGTERWLKHGVEREITIV